MQTIISEFESDFRIKGSKFIGVLFPCISLEEFENRLQAIRKEYYDASHHCYAYRIGVAQTREYSSDDGEPSGTAGLPILNQLKTAELVNCGCIVIRYFGGSKLGKSGLIESYGEGARLAVQKADLKTIVQVRMYDIAYEYSHENEINQMVQTFDLIEQCSEYGKKVHKSFACPLKKADPFTDYLRTKTYLGIQFEENSDTYVMN